MRCRKANASAGLSLVELLVAMTILALATLIAMTIYDDARRSYKIGENVTEQQQAVRIAFDLMVSDIRHDRIQRQPGREQEPARRTDRDHSPRGRHPTGGL